MLLRDQVAFGALLLDCDFRMLLLDYLAMWNKSVISKLMVPHRIHIIVIGKFLKPSHVWTMLLLSYLSHVVLHSEPRLLWQPSSLTAFLYLSTFATHFGTQIWMTFVSGIVLFFKLPRKLFGMVQRQLFPKYFLLNTVLGSVTLWTFVLHNCSSNEGLSLQKWALCICLVCDLIALVYIVPDMVKTMELRSTIAAEAKPEKSGDDVDEAELKRCPAYLALHKRFRRFHGACAIVNFIAMICNSLHMYHLSMKVLSTIT